MLSCLLALRKTHAINFAFHLYKKVASMQAISLDRSKIKLKQVDFQWKNMERVAAVCEMATQV